MNDSLNRWLLVNYAGYPFSPNSLMPDNGLANLAAVLLKNKKEVQIVDYCTVDTARKLMANSPQFIRTKKSAGKIDLWSQLRTLVDANLRSFKKRKQNEMIEFIVWELAEKIKKNKIECLGFKLWMGDGFEATIKIASKLKMAFPKLIIIAGGPQVDIFMGDILKECGCFDALIYGEGEEALAPFAEKGKKKASYEGIPNLIYIKDGKFISTNRAIVEDINELPLPVYDPNVYPAMQGNEKIKIIVIDESRGCKNNCAFCIHPIKSNNCIRLKKIKRLISEVGHLNDDFNIHTFRFAGSCTPYSLLNEFADELLKQKMKVHYSTFAHVRGGDKANFELMKKSGCEAVFFGIESGSQKILNLMRKGIKVENITETFRLAKDAGIYAVGSLIFPAPGEDSLTEKETLDLIEKIRPDAMPIQFPVVTPRTDWFDSPEKYTIKIKSRQRYTKELMKWKIKTYLPPRYWDDLPISITGRNFKEVLGETSRMINLVEQMGVTTSISDDLFLMSTRIDQSVLVFRDTIRQAFLLGDYEKIAEIVWKINSNI
jgi:radical SAM superfamily enzyme YgiQ (UPF0313 family)